MRNTLITLREVSIDTTDFGFLVEVRDLDARNEVVAESGRYFDCGEQAEGYANNQVRAVRGCWPAVRVRGRNY
jgi:hypothetical protein